MAEAAFFQIIFEALHAIEISRYAQLAATSIVIYDHFLTLDDEIELIWKSNWSVGKALFIINRYYTLVGTCVYNYGLFSTNLTETFCSSFFKWQGWSGFIAFMIAEGILQMRLYALYLLNKKILAVMLVSFAIANAAAGYVMGIALAAVQPAPPLLPTRPLVCVPLNIPDYFWTYWVPIISMESLLCGLALYQGVRTFTKGEGLFQSGRRIVGILIRDSAFYYLVMFSAYLTCLLIWAAAPQNLLEVPIPFSVAFSCVIANRLIINVRKENQEIEASKASKLAGAAGLPGGGFSGASHHTYRISHLSIQPTSPSGGSFLSPTSISSSAPLISSPREGSDSNYSDKSNTPLAPIPTQTPGPRRTRNGEYSSYWSGKANPFSPSPSSPTSLMWDDKQAGSPTSMGIRMPSYPQPTFPDVYDPTYHAAPFIDPGRGERSRTVSETSYSQVFGTRRGALSDIEMNELRSMRDETWSNAASSVGVIYAI